MVPCCINNTITAAELNLNAYRGTTFNVTIELALDADFNLPVDFSDFEGGEMVVRLVPRGGKTYLKAEYPINLTATPGKINIQFTPEEMDIPADNYQYDIIGNTTDGRVVVCRGRLIVLQNA